MISKDFKIDFENKKISYYPSSAKASADKPERGGKIYTVNELYSYLMDIFDEPINMQYEIPIKAKPDTGRHPAKSKPKAKTKYFLINGWAISHEGARHLNDKLGKVGVKPTIHVDKQAQKTIGYIRHMNIIDINGNERKCAKAYPDPTYPGFIKVEFVTPRRSYSEWYPINDFLAKNPNLTDLVKGTKPEAPEINGTVTSATGITLTDKTQNWEKNAYTGFPVWISRGQGEGQVRDVESNTKDTLVIDKEWEEKPNKFSEYILSRNIHEHMTATGNESAKEMQEKHEKEAEKMEKKRKKAQSIFENLKIVDEN